MCILNSSDAKAKSPLCPFVPSKGVDERTQLDASSGEALELGCQSVDSATAGYAKSQRPVGSQNKEMGVTDHSDQSLPVTYWEAEQGDTQVTQVKEGLKQISLSGKTH